MPKDKAENGKCFIFGNVINNYYNCKILNLHKMKTNLKVRLVLTVFFAWFMLHASAQVTIGSDIAPNAGALLDLKQTASTGGAATVAAGGGLNLPRITLTSLTSLVPLIATHTTTEASAHIGLTVYNLSATSPFKPGVYVWDGAKWAPVGAGSVGFFYMPSFNLPLTSTGTKTYDLFAEFKKQLGNSPTSPTYKTSDASVVIPANVTGLATDFTYIVTDYSTDIITVTGVSAAGVLTYNVLSLVPTLTSYINIVMVPKN
jgi:hypothetical protein